MNNVRDISIYSVVPCLNFVILKFHSAHQDNYFFHFQVKLHYTEKALGLIAKKAMAKNTGARGLRALLESILTDAMYEVCNQVFLKLWLQ